MAVTISAKEVQALRERTGVGMMECKRALVETEGDMDKAVTLLRERGLAVAAKKATRIASEGVIAQFCANGKAAICEINSETDFVAKNQKFVDFANAVAETVAECNPADVDALLETKIAGGDMTVEEARKEKILVIGENIQIRRFAREEGCVFCYNHGNGRIGVMVKLAVTPDFYASAEFAVAAKNICMQIAAMNANYLAKEDVPADILQNEKDILLAQINNDPKQASKPDAVKEKMISGKLGKFYSENVLLEQDFFFDETIKVGKYIEGLCDGAKLLSFTRFERGEGLAKREDDFASEVAKMAQQ